MLNMYGCNFNMAKSWLSRLFLVELKAGFIPVAFVDFWFADQLNSLVIIFVDIGTVLKYMF